MAERESLFQDIPHSGARAFPFRPRAVVTDARWVERFVRDEYWRLARERRLLRVGRPARSLNRDGSDLGTTLAEAHLPTFNERSVR